MSNLLDVSLENGKYTIIQSQKGKVYALRYGEPWRDCCGDGLILSLAQEVETLQKEVEELKHINQLKKG